MTASPEHLPDDFAAAIKAADDYADALNELALHDLTKPMTVWLWEAERIVSDEHLVTLRDAARTFGGQS